MKGAGLVACLVYVAACAATGQEFGDAGKGPWERVPLATLIANGQPFDGKRVWVAGVLRVEFEGDSLYLTKEHYAHRVSQNALWLSIDIDQLGASRKRVAEYNGRYVFVSGIYRHGDRGHMSAFQGAIRDVNHILVMRGDHPVRIAPE